MVNKFVPQFVRFSFLPNGILLSISLRHMNTIELQLEVTRFLHRCENAAPSNCLQTSAPPTKSVGSSSPPTLFGGSAMKVEVACKVTSCLESSQCGLELFSRYFDRGVHSPAWVFSNAGDAWRKKHWRRLRHCIQGHPGMSDRWLWLIKVNLSELFWHF